MTDDSVHDSDTKKLENTDEEDCTLVPLLSEYSKKLESHVRRRYTENISVIGIDLVSPAAVFSFGHATQH